MSNIRQIIEPFLLVLTGLIFLYNFYLVFRPCIKHWAINTTRYVLASCFVILAGIYFYWILSDAATKVHFSTSTWVAALVAVLFGIVLNIHGLLCNVLNNHLNTHIRISLSAIYAIVTLFLLILSPWLIFLSLVGNMQICSTLSHGDAGRCGSVQY